MASTAGPRLHLMGWLWKLSPLLALARPPACCPWTPLFPLSGCGAAGYPPALHRIILSAGFQGAVDTLISPMRFAKATHGVARGGPLRTSMGKVYWPGPGWLHWTGRGPPRWGLPTRPLLLGTTVTHVCLYSVAFLSSKPWGYLRRHPLARATEDLGWARLRVVPFPIPGLLGALELCGGGTPLSRHCGRDMWTYRPKRPSGCAEPGLSHSTPTPREGLCKSVFPMSPHVALESRAWVLQLRDLLLPPDGATPMYRGLLRLRDTLDLPRSCVLPLSAAPWGAGGGHFVFGSMDGTFPVGKTVSLYSTSPAYPALPTL